MGVRVALRCGSISTYGTSQAHIGRWAFQNGHVERVVFHSARLTQTPWGFRRMVRSPFPSPTAKFGILCRLAGSLVRIGHSVALASERPTYG